MTYALVSGAEAMDMGPGTTCVGKRLWGRAPVAAGVVLGNEGQEARLTWKRQPPSEPASSRLDDVNGRTSA